MKRRIPTNAELMDVIRRKAEAGEDAAQELREMLDDNLIHICKRSAGWHIHFDHNYGRYWNTPTRESIRSYMEENGLCIVDEYGKEYGDSEFWGMVDEWESSRDDLWDDEAYYAANKDITPWRHGGETLDYYASLCRTFDLRGMLGDRTCNTDFRNDGLYWLTSSDFE